MTREFYISQILCCFVVFLYNGKRKEQKGWKEFYCSGRENNPSGVWLKVIIII